MVGTVSFILEGHYFAGGTKTAGQVLDEILEENKLNHNSCSDAHFTFQVDETLIEIHLKDVGEHK